MMEIPHIASKATSTTGPPKGFPVNEYFDLYTNLSTMRPVRNNKPNAIVRIPPHRDVGKSNTPKISTKATRTIQYRQFNINFIVANIMNC